jgi:hypothetical protein
MIKAHPASGDPLPVALATEINRYPDRFWTRRGAARAKEQIDRLGLPVRLLVVDAR